MTSVERGYIVIIWVILFMAFPCCGQGVKVQGEDKYVDTSGRRARTDFIMDFKKAFEAKCLLPEKDWCRCKIRDVTPSGFFYGVARPHDRDGTVYENIYYRFSMKPTLRERFVEGERCFEITQEGTPYPPMRARDEEEALRIYGLLESIYRTY